MNIIQNKVTVEWDQTWNLVSTNFHVKLLTAARHAAEATDGTTRCVSEATLLGDPPAS